MGSPEALGKALAHVVQRGDFTVPPYPAVALRLQRLLAKPNYSVSDIADVVSGDPALATAVLAAANSAALGAAVQITTLPRAVNRLGARTVGSIAVAAGLGASASAPGLLLDVKYRVWRRSVTCALACQKLAPQRGLEPEAAFLAGLLHGFGRSVAIASLERLLADHRPARPLGLEEWLGIAEQHRAELARAVAERWQLPSELVECMHAYGAESGRSALARLVAESDRIAAGIEAGGIPELADAEARAIDELSTTLPGLLTSLATPPAPAAARDAGVVAKPERALQGDLRNKSLDVTDRSTKSSAALSCVGIAPSGLRLESSRPFQESSVVRLSVNAGSQQLEPWFSVVLCAKEGAKYRVELELFSPTREIKQAWLALYEQ
jgi:HD-like signal output (HDOD) protein